MSITIENILLIGSVLLFMSVVAGKTSYRFGIPTLVLFLFIGMLSGSEGFGGIYFNDPKIAQFIGIVSLNIILFSGGLDTRWKEIKPVFFQGITLSTIGVFITALTLGVFIWLITDFTIYEGLLLGSIVSSTDAAAVFSILRSKKMALKNNLRPLLELESGSNDPMAYVLTITFLGLVMSPEQGFLAVIPVFLRQMILGTIMGFVFGKVSKMIINGIRLELDGLYTVLVLSLLFFTFAFTDAIGGNGFLAIYLCGVYLGNQDIIHKKTILKMFDGLAWLMQIVLFLTLGLLVFPSQLLPVAGLGLLISAFLIFVARPLSIFIGLLPFKMKLRSKVYVSWVGLRGAVPIVFATYPLIAGIEKANLIFNIVFFISLTSVLLQGTTLEKVAKWLKVSMPEKIKKKSNVEQFLDEYAKTRMVEIEVPEDNIAVGQKIIDLRFPPNSIIAMINRNKKFFTPNGSTIIESHDILVVLADNQLGINNIYEVLEIPRPE
ncbi:MAG: potassium/proton antiporter [Bacteroidales bacterium]|jgi:cell volume regulation protein A|nr:potassium/proton antiporter [Bacteroidales bacterium]